MLIMTGKIVMIESKEIVKSEVDRCMKVTLVLVKQMKGKKRNVCFESYGKVAVCVCGCFLFKKNGSWYHTLKAVEVEKEVKAQKNDNTNQNTINYDTTEKGFE